MQTKRFLQLRCICLSRFLQHDDIIKVKPHHAVHSSKFGACELLVPQSYPSSLASGLRQTSCPASIPLHPCGYFQDVFIAQENKDLNLSQKFSSKDWQIFLLVRTLVNVSFSSSDSQQERCSLNGQCTRSSQ